MTMPTKCEGIKIEFMDGEEEVNSFVGEYRVEDGVLHTYVVRSGGFGYSGSSEPRGSYPLTNILRFGPVRY